MDSIFYAWAESYSDAGYSVLPLNGKSPFFNEWERYSAERPTNKEIEKWMEQHPHSNIGVVCGPASKICSIDYDYIGNDKEKIESILETILPPSPVRKRGAKGWTAFYKYTGLENFLVDRNGERLVDFISTGKQTVLPPSIHPLTNKPYVWITEDTLLDYDPNDLPSLDKDIVDKIKILGEIDFSKTENPFGKRTGRHDKIVAHAWKIINKVDSVELLSKEMIAYDKEISGDKPYFSDRKYFKEPAEKAALSLAQSLVKWLKKIKLKSGVVWDVGNKIISEEELFFPRDIDKINQKHWANKSEFLLTEIDENEKEKRIPLLNEMSSYMRDVEGLKIYNGEYIYTHNSVFYQYLDKNQLKKVIQMRVSDKFSTAAIEQFFRRLMIDCQEIGEIPQKPEGLINLKNGVLDVKNDKLLPHSKKYFFKQAINVDYDKSAKCELWESTLLDIFSNDKDLIKTVQEMFGYILVGGDPFLHKSFVLHGTGRNGKGIIINMLKALLGRESYSSVSLENLDRAFATVLMDGKLANLSEETPSEINSEIFKTIVGGGEIQVSKKGKDEYLMKCNARMVFACNDFPYFNDKNFSILDRLFFIPFNKTYVEGENRDPFLLDKLIPELPGILNWAIQGAFAVMKNRKIVQSLASIEMKEEFREDNDQVFSWFKDCVKIEGIAGGVKEKTVDEIYMNYTLWTETSGNKPMGKNPFSKRLKRIIKEFSGGLLNQDRWYDDAGNFVRGYRMLRIKSIFKEYDFASKDYKIKRGGFE